MKLIMAIVALCISINGQCNDVYKSTMFLEIDSTTKESMQYYTLLGDNKKISTLTPTDLLIISGRHLNREEELRPITMCGHGQVPLIFLAEISHIQITTSSVVVFIDYYASCFFLEDVSDAEIYSGVLKYTRVYD